MSSMPTGGSSAARSQRQRKVSVLHKEDRLHESTPPKPPGGDVRSVGERDRDRVLYSSAFRRLAGVTQVAGPLESHVFHNRLTHTLEVAQIARRLSQRLVRTEESLLSAYGGLDVEMAEAAALAHDLGHPPFGHVAEEELDRLVREVGRVHDGFEGNAQSFRILTKLAAHRHGYHGLDLSRGTLNAVLKYPWLRRDAPKEKPKKFGAYTSEAAYLDFARALGPQAKLPSLEASVMDHADAIAYSVHDLEDFYRAGLIPLGQLRDDEFFAEELAEFRKEGKSSNAAIDAASGALKEFAELIPLPRRYRGTRAERATIREFSSVLIGRLLAAINLVEEGGSLRLEMEPREEVLMRFLQNLVWRYVIKNPSLATQQYGQRRIVEDLFCVYHKALEGTNPDLSIIPFPFRSLCDTIDQNPDAWDQSPREHRQVRVAADIVASLTDQQAVLLHQRLTGRGASSLLDGW